MADQNYPGRPETGFRELFVKAPTPALPACRGFHHVFEIGKDRCDCRERPVKDLWRHFGNELETVSRAAYQRTETGHIARELNKLLRDVIPYLSESAGEIPSMDGSIPKGSSRRHHPREETLIGIVHHLAGLLEEATQRWRINEVLLNAARDRELAAKFAEYENRAAAENAKEKP